MKLKETRAIISLMSRHIDGLRRQKAITKVEMARLCGLSVYKVQSICNGKRDIMLKDLIAMSKGLDIPCSEFFDFM